MITPEMVPAIQIYPGIGGYHIEVDHWHKQMIRLIDAGYTLECVSVEHGHFRIDGCVDWWPSTGSWKATHVTRKARKGFKAMLHRVDVINQEEVSRRELS